MPSGSMSQWLRGIVGVLMMFSIIQVFSLEAKAQPPELIIQVGDTVGPSGQQNSVITVFMDNPMDSVVAFELLLRIGNREILEFQTDSATVYDTTYWICTEWDGPDCLNWVGSDAAITYWICDSLVGDTCVDSTQVPQDSAWEWQIVADTMIVDISEVVIGSIDTAGTLVSGWESVVSRSVIVEGEDIKVTAIADRLTVPGTVPGIAPQQGGILFRLLADIFPMDDTTTDRTSPIIPDPFKDHFSFSAPGGQALGISYYYVDDTNYYWCESWVPPDSTTCLKWVKVSGEPYDSMNIEVDTISYVDTCKVKLRTGYLTVLHGICGQLDDDPEGAIDIGDVTFLIDYLFLDGPEPDPRSNAQMDCDPLNEVDIGDLTWLINYLFMSGPAPCDCQ